MPQYASVHSAESQRPSKHIYFNISINDHQATFLPYGERDRLAREREREKECRQKIRTECISDKSTLHSVFVRYIKATARSWWVALAADDDDNDDGDGNETDEGVVVFVCGDDDLCP